MIIKKDSEIVIAKLKGKSLALKARIIQVDEECSTSRKVKTKSTPWRCEDPNHLIGECPKPPRDKNQRAFVGGSWSDSGEEDDSKIQDETCLVCSFMLCDLDFKPLSLSLSSLPSCDLVSLINMLILFIILKALFQSLRKSLSLNLELS
ncbi:hypothetical protein Tco_1238869 [Tanacetum coccineum]